MKTVRTNAGAVAVAVPGSPTRLSNNPFYCFTIGLAAALFTEGEPEQGAAAAHQALDEATRIDSTLVASRINTLLDAARPYRTAAVDEIRTRAAGLAAARPTTVAA